MKDGGCGFFDVCCDTAEDVEVGFCGGVTMGLAFDTGGVAAGRGCGRRSWCRASRNKESANVAVRSRFLELASII